MVQSCCVVNCYNRARKESGVSFHKFPWKEPDRCAKWISSICRVDKDGKPWHPTPNDRVCSAHFQYSDYFHYQGLSRSELREGSVPSVFPIYLPHKYTQKRAAMKYWKRSALRDTRSPCQAQGETEVSEDSTKSLPSYGIIVAEEEKYLSIPPIEIKTEQPDEWDHGVENEHHNFEVEITDARHGKHCGPEIKVEIIKEEELLTNEEFESVWNGNESSPTVDQTLEEDGEIVNARHDEQCEPKVKMGIVKEEALLSLRENEPPTPHDGNVSSSNVDQTLEEIQEIANSRHGEHGMPEVMQEIAKEDDLLSLIDSKSPFDGYDDSANANQKLEVPKGLFVSSHYDMASSSEVCLDKHSELLGNEIEIEASLPMSTNSIETGKDCQSETGEDCQSENEKKAENPNVTLTHGSITDIWFDKIRADLAISSRQEQGIHDNVSHQSVNTFLTIPINTQRQSSKAKRLYKCVTCGNRGIKRYECDMCGIKGRTVYECDTCGRRFNRKAYLEKHKLTHTRETPYKCDSCEKSFSVLFSLHFQQRAHTEETPYVCHGCFKEYISPGHLNLRKKQTNTEDKDHSYSRDFLEILQVPSVP